MINNYEFLYDLPLVRGVEYEMNHEGDNIKVKVADFQDMVYPVGRDTTVEMVRTAYKRHLESQRDLRVRYHRSMAHVIKKAMNNMIGTINTAD